MSRVFKLTSFAVLSTTIAVSYYHYAVKDNGFHYETSEWKKINDKVKRVVDGTDVIQFSGLSDRIKTPTDVIVRPRGETFKDLWNSEVRRTVQWIYSFGEDK